MQTPPLRYSPKKVSYRYKQVLPGDIFYVTEFRNQLVVALNSTELIPGSEFVSKSVKIYTLGLS